MAAGEVDHPAVARGIALAGTRTPGRGRRVGRGRDYTGGGFPRVFYLRYHGYAKIFPLWALARYRNLKRGNEAAWPSACERSSPVDAVVAMTAIARRGSPTAGRGGVGTRGLEAARDGAGA